MGFYEECDIEQTWYIPVYKAVWSDGTEDASWHSADLSNQTWLSSEEEANQTLNEFYEWWNSQERAGRTIVTAVVREVKTTKRTLLK